MLPRFSMAFSRWTSTPWRAISCAPRARLTRQDGGEQLRAQPHGERDGEEQRLDRRASEQHVRREHHEHHHEHRAGEEVAEPAQPAVELRLRGPQRQPVGDGAELGRGAGRDDETARGAAAHVRAEEDAVGALGEDGRAGDDPRRLLDGEALARQHRLVHEAVRRFENDGIRRDQASRGQHDHVPWHHLAERDRHRSRVPQDSRHRLHPGSQLVGSHLSAVFPRVADSDARDEDRQHDGSVDPRPRERGGSGGEDQEQQQGASKLVPEDARPGQLSLLPELVGPILGQPACRFRRGEARRPRAEMSHHLGRVQRPVGVQRVRFGGNARWA